MDGIRILVVEDILIHRIMIERLLKPFGTCETVADGLAGLVSFEQAFFEKNPYRVVVLDIMMPEMSGQEALRQIRHFEDLQKVPVSDRAKILMATAQNDRDSVIESMYGQCDGYILKPIQRDILYKTLEELGLKKDPDR